MAKGFEVWNLDTNESHGVYDTLSEARGCVLFDSLRAYEIVLTDGTDGWTRIEKCEPYDGDDDRDIEDDEA